MEINENHIKVTKTARYFTVGTLNPLTKYVWILLHGYGQLAYYFAQHFSALVRPDTYLIFPEGLSRFYLSEQYERVGASWMTRENRHLEIEDQMAYLDTLVETLILNQKDYQPQSTKHIVLGFSQGTATAWRWLNHTQFLVDYLVLWAGMVPQEIEKIKHLQNLKVFTAYGDNDPFITPERVHALKEILDQIPNQYQLVPYHGAHTIEANALNQIINQIYQ